MDDNQSLGYVYINESFQCNSEVKNLDHHKTNDLFYVTFDANLQDFDVENRNKRYYDANNIMDCIKSEKIQSLLASNGWFGEFEHPTPEIDGQKLSPERIQNVPPKERAFKIMKPRLVGNVLQATIQSAQGEVGEGFGKEVLAGWIPQYSARAIANMISKNGKPYVMVKKLITYDAPWYPSHRCAHMTSKPSVTSISFNESVNDLMIDETAKDIFIPLTDILKDIGQKDLSVGAVMEAFELDMSDLVGISADKKHAIIKDADNYIYSNIDPKTVHKVHDFYNSLHI